MSTLNGAMLQTAALPLTLDNFRLVHTSFWAKHQYLANFVHLACELFVRLVIMHVQCTYLMHIIWCHPYLLSYLKRTFRSIVCRLHHYVLSNFVLRPKRFATHACFTPTNNPRRLFSGPSISGNKSSPLISANETTEADPSDRIDSINYIDYAQTAHIETNNLIKTFPWLNN